MKRANHLYNQIATHENLRVAFHKAAKGKQTNSEVVQFRIHFDAGIQSLRDQLLSRQPDVGHYHFFVVRDPKVRTICAASFPERVLHHAIMNLCEPVLDSYAIHDSYACRKGKGNRRALARAQQFTRRYAWHLKLDIRKYFDSIDHSTVMQLLARQFKEKDLLELFHTILETYHTQPGKGLPIGNLISQHLANFYLGLFDELYKENRQSKTSGCLTSIVLIPILFILIFCYHRSKIFCDPYLYTSRQSRLNASVTLPQIFNSCCPFYK